MSADARTVLVLGAGFTKAFYPAAPTLIDDFGAQQLLVKYQGFPHAARILKTELAKLDGRRVNLEQLMTRLDSKLPYDYQYGTVGELDELLQDLLRELQTRIIRASDGDVVHEADLKAFARHCVTRRINCITFNYDDYFDQALDAFKGGGENRWRPDDGYGFYCRHVLRLFHDYESWWNPSSSLLLKLHGSLNWYAKLGAPRPYMLDSIVHSEDWYEPDIKKTLPPGVMHIKPGQHHERSPILVAPVLDKSSLREQPVLRVVWSEAWRVLNNAQRVIFVGYSLPTTDLAARWLFSESIKLDHAQIDVVDYCPNRNRNNERAELVRTYQDAFPGAKIRFEFGGAREWAERFQT